MNREIKFRGKRVDNGEWVYGGYVKGKSGKSFIFQGNDLKADDDDCCVVIPETVGQFTGLKDKNGIEIYENDIVKAGRRWEFGKIVNLSYDKSFFYDIQEYVLEDVLEVIG